MGSVDVVPNQSLKASPSETTTTPNRLVDVEVKNGGVTVDQEGCIGSKGEIDLLSAYKPTGRWWYLWALSVDGLVNKGAWVVVRWGDTLHRTRSDKMGLWHDC